MSQDPLRAGPVSDDASPADGRGLINHERGPAGNRHPSRRPPLRTRPQSWHPYGPVEPPLESAQSRPTGVHAILNPPEQGAAGSHEPRTLPGPADSPRPRQGSSPSLRPVRPLVQQPLSPRSHSRPLMQPGSPSARFVSGSGRSSGPPSVMHSPMIPQEPPLSQHHPASSSPLPLDSALRPVASLPGTQPPVLTSLHSTPAIPSRRTSTGPGPLTNPSSQETSPSTPQSSYSHFGRVSPAVTNVSLPPSATPYTAAPPYMKADPLTRGVSATADPRAVKEEPSTSTSQSASSLPGMIPCILDLKSGSSTQAEKRKANSDASRRFRNRKRNEMQLEQRLTAQQDEIQRHVDTVRRQSDEIRALIQQRDHYRSERDFFRDHLGRSVSPNQLPPRPASPRPAMVPTVDAGSAQHLSSAADPARSAAAVPQPPARLLDAARPQGSWPGSPASYSPVPLPPAGRGVAAGPSPVAGGPLPPFQGSWSRP
ncbi:hypothetical protein NUU61_005360 [Penicillium alfredii]|uniref:BZIP domain-containing protein n=1 Tax=Penicillium alfredii TaxID=1506179 RepID=A0A9W9F9N4_9EURO|nr:uncharacterized protein NUU61_005360 [Penicillium alfredii]KAJ5096004.1 hypothetical protein NUU61_005360 [Penicillium alfredii]